MKISASGGGGLSGAAEHYEVDTARLHNGEMLEELLRNLDFLPPPPPRVGADIVRWDITIDDGQQRRVVSFAEDGSPESAPFQALLAELRASA